MKIPRFRVSVCVCIGSYMFFLWFMTNFHWSTGMGIYANESHSKKIGRQWHRYHKILCTHLIRMFTIRFYVEKERSKRKSSHAREKKEAPESWKGKKKIELLKKISLCNRSWMLVNILEDEQRRRMYKSNEKFMHRWNEHYVGRITKILYFSLTFSSISFINSDRSKMRKIANLLTTMHQKSSSPSRSNCNYFFLHAWVMFLKILRLTKMSMAGANSRSSFSYRLQVIFSCNFLRFKFDENLKIESFKNFTM